MKSSLICIIWWSLPKGRIRLAGKFKPVIKKAMVELDGNISQNSQVRNVDIWFSLRARNRSIILKFYASVIRCTFQEICIVKRAVGSREPIYQSRSVLKGLFELIFYGPKNTFFKYVRKSQPIYFVSCVGYGFLYMWVCVCIYIFFLFFFSMSSIIQEMEPSKFDLFYVVLISLQVQFNLLVQRQMWLITLCCWNSGLKHDRISLSAPLPPPQKKRK